MSFSKGEIQESFRKEDGQYFLSKREGRSDIWQRFGQVTHSDTGIKLPFNACYNCKTVYTDSGGGTGNITRHRCPTIPKFDLSFLYSEAANKPENENISAEINLSEFLGHNEPSTAGLIKEEPINEKDDQTANLLALLGQEIKAERLDEDVLDETQQLTRASQLTRQNPTQSRGSNQDRSLKMEIHQLLASGSPEIVLEKHHKYDSISVILRYVEGEIKKTLYVICIICGTMLRNAEGGHINRHVQSSCPGSTKLDLSAQLALASTRQEEISRNISAAEIDESSILATYCLKMCLDFNTIIDPSFHLIMEKIGNLTRKLPRVEEVEAAALNIYQNLKANTQLQMRQMINQGEAILLVDPGKYIPGVLSVFINCSTSDIQKHICVLNKPSPIGFSTSFQPTDDPELMFEQILSICTNFGLSKTEVQQCSLCSEPTFAMMECGKLYMNEHYPVMSVQLDPILRTILQPSVDFDSQLSASEQAVSKIFRDIVSVCEAISQEAKKKITLEAISRKIARIVKDDWLSRTTLVVDIFINWEEIFVNKELFTTVNIKQLNDKKEHLKEFMEIFKLFQTTSKALQKDGVGKMHLVISSYKHLLNDLQNLSKDALKSDTFRILAEVAAKAVDQYCDGIFVKTYFLASILYPASKNLKIISPVEHQMAMENLIIMLKNNSEGEPTTKKAKVDNSECEAEVLAYLNHSVSNNTSLFSFWSQNSQNYKNLSRIARTVFACRPIDSLCKNYVPIVSKWRHSNYLDEDHEWVLLASALIR